MSPIGKTLVMGWLSWIIPGLLAGALARLLVPTGKRIGCIGTILLGIVGSVVGGTLGSVLTGDGFDVSRGGFIGSVIGAMVVLLVVRLGKD